METQTQTATVQMTKSTAIETPLPMRAAERFVKRSKLQPLVKLTRAHLAIAARPEVSSEAGAALAAAIAALTTQLGVKAEITAALADATVHPFTHLSKHAVFAIFELGAGLALVEIDALTAGTLLHHAAGSLEDSVPTSLTRVEEAALASLFLAVLAGTRGSSFDARYHPRLVSLHANHGEVLQTVDARVRHLAISLTLNIAGRAGSGRVIVPAQLVQAAIDVLPQVGAVEIAPEVLAATLDATCRLGCARLQQAEFEAVSVGDVVMFGAVTHHNGAFNGPARLITNTFTLNGQLSADGFALTPPTQENTMSASENEMPVDVEIELTRLRLALSELSSLRAGAVVPLRINAAQTVTLRVGDKAVAKAELVEIEGEIGARILTLL